MGSLWLLLALPLPAQPAAPPLAVGKGSFVFQDASVNAGRPITVWSYRPAGSGPDQVAGTRSPPRPTPPRDVRPTVTRRIDPG
ncbi:MAG TPA: hypothetical protein PLB88_02465 [Thermoanaerobaculaceae bacterium]|nr:hypothetical protein [Thermoanaerobaculaceae bacterium]HQU33153.1 hypothetical protein [Thermoanaerobaculaceae bacterium]